MLQLIDQPKIATYTIVLGTLFSHLRRFNRILKYENVPEIYSVELSREMENIPFENWNPAENPEWLLLELELDVTIRPIQVRVTNHMMNMSGEKNGVTQLNMGEGKTSVIVPMIVSTLSKKENLLCRVTVLSSIFTTNFNLLSFTIGGLLNKRLYTVPCRRDYDVFENLTKIKETYEESLRLKGVIMTLPEYRLSFRLMMCNYYLEKHNDSAYQVYSIENWLRRHVRDIVDESDEIFSVKFQLIYTTGKQLPIDGGNMRWVVCQKLLQIIPPIATKLFHKFGSTVIEFHQEDAETNPEQFTHFRILSNECKIAFYEEMAEAVLEGKIDLLGVLLNENERRQVKTFLINEDITEEDHKAVINMKCISDEKKEILLLISGYLRRGVLLTALNKRWRVQCGVNEKGEKMMAVPFRAKDVAAEKTEFGHPDVAIVLTQLSYYYSGLNDKQLLETFTLLKTVVGPEKLYNMWIKRIPEHKGIHHSIQKYKGINLLDYEQRTNHLFPALRKHKAVIDFWLENFVFPKEAKQFPGKLVMNAWDLCYENYHHSTTGFSGTNDSSLLLPNTISQQDLDELKKTNEELEATLQGKENGWKRSLPMGVTCKTILESMKEDGLRVLIDAGAMVLELGNEALAKLWLEVDSSLEGIVYFTDGNELVIKTRSSSQGTARRKMDTPLKLSSYRDRLANCAVYLDDYHTRGTDLKLPSDFKACVTIGSKMRRDKLMQACMRMRKLGNGQSVQFYLSHEADIKIRKMRSGNHNDSLSVLDILEWVRENSKEFEEEGLVYWAANARNYAQKLAADVYYDMSSKDPRAGGILAKQCEDPEVFSIQALYGQYKKKELIVDVIPYWFSSVERKLKMDAGILELPTQIQDIMERYRNIVLQKCKSRIPNKSLLYSMLDEEQEKELEPEQEEEAEFQRTPREQALKPQLSRYVEHYITVGGCIPSKYPGTMSLPFMFKNTSCWELIEKQVGGWGSTLFVTEDFINVIRSHGSSMQDSFLRPITYITSWQSNEDQQQCLLILSPFEVNEMMPLFHSNAAKVTLHMFAGRYMEDQDILVNKSRLQLPHLRRGMLELDENVLSPILIAAGNLFYASMKEQKAFAGFLGLCLRPWGKEEEKAFKDRLITSTGFVLPNISKEGVCLRTRSNFQNEPTGMVRAILKCRNDVLRDSDHVVRMLDQCGFIEMNDK
ncbi:unnamed protein product [Orchesella dallaii]|uniref:ubiquitinyl hydrolase 1 n=1 Tax=Orchesella dallaii TaxID=48710 RepID=A0ABP1RS40_9HEXA